ncbi:MULTISPECIES: ESX secretion-associated protein EspG [unclassified Nocardia]|uniref:ESX secretion-associated protein EspG n=1 Tax=unclassified Nocardia TaxID=2637762 RepID=UPI001CE46C82|nr:MULTISPECIES: ESX secretion-associated protein EspG [unclassified Nocardia]
MSSLRTAWKFSDMEFFVLWEDQRAGFLPKPLTFASRTEWFDELLEDKAKARDALYARDDPEIKTVLAALQRPELRIELNAWDDRDRVRADARIRLYGVRLDYRCYLVTQLPGETYRHSSGFVISEGDAHELAAAVVAALPDCPPGRDAEVVLSTMDTAGEIDYRFGRSQVRASFDDTVRERSKRFLSTPAERLGTIEIIQAHSLFGPRGMTRHRLELRDLEGDGRYLVEGEHPPIAVAADRKRMVAMIDSRIEEVMAVIDDERR